MANAAHMSGLDEVLEILRDTGLLGATVDLYLPIVATEIDEGSG